MDLTQRTSVRAIAYARTSKVLGQDPTLQILAIREFARQRGYEIVAEHIDQVTGDRERRKGLDALILDCKMGRANVIITTALDRIFRSTKHMLALVDELNNSYNVKIISIRENLDFSTPAGAMALTVLAAVSTLEKSIISDRIKSSLKIRQITAQQTGNGWTCGRRPLPKEIVDQVLAFRKSGASIRKIAKTLGIGKTSVERILKKVA
jgi:putative DNA-invertase from lambdoid prophage Rac